MKLALIAVLLSAVSYPAFAGLPVPEIDGAVAFQALAVAGALAALLKKRR